MNQTDILGSINILLEKIYKSVEGSIYPMLDSLSIIDENILKKAPLNLLFDEGKENGVVLIAYVFISFHLIVYIFQRLISLYNGKVPENIYKVIIKIVLGAIVMTFSLFICELILKLNYAFTESIKEFGKSITKNEICFVELRETINNLEKYMNSDFVSLDGMIKTFISFGSITLLINYAVRYVTIIFLILISPITIVLACSNATFGVFKSWIRNLLVNLLMQSVVIFILIIPLTFKDINNDIFKIVIVGSIYLLYKINDFSKELIGNILHESEQKRSIY